MIPHIGGIPEMLNNYISFGNGGEYMQMNSSTSRHYDLYITVVFSFF